MSVELFLSQSSVGGFGDMTPEHEIIGTPFQVREKMLIPSFTRSLKDPFHHSRIACCNSFAGVCVWGGVLCLVAVCVS